MLFPYFCPDEIFQDFMGQALMKYVFKFHGAVPIKKLVASKKTIKMQKQTHTFAYDPC